MLGGDLAEDAGRFAATYLHLENLGATSKNVDIQTGAKKVSHMYLL